MPERMPKLPDPIKVVDGIGDVVMEVPKLPARIVQSVGGAVAGMGADMKAAADQITNVPDDMVPDPVTLVTGVVNYVVAIPKGVVKAIGGGISSVGDTLGSIESRLRRLAG
ncbi:MAG: hypothetical protein ABIH46_12190 [Chloroflexota bacterium]